MDYRLSLYGLCCACDFFNEFTQQQQEFFPLLSAQLFVYIESWLAKVYSGQKVVGEENVVKEGEIMIALQSLVLPANLPTFASDGNGPTKKMTMMRIFNSRAFTLKSSLPPI